VKRLVLWDIDGTLLRSGEIGALIFDAAIEKVVGVRPRQPVTMSGKTDPQIVTEYLTDLDHPDVAGQIPLVLAGIESELAAQAHRIGVGGGVLPGIAELLPRLHGHGEVLQTVLTGNIAPNARLKLAAFGLDAWLNLEMGAFGSDHADRTRLVPVALGRVAEARGRVFDPAEVWVVGDAPNDLACARAGGARCLLVATGRSGYEELAALGPDAVRHDLGDVDAVVDLLAS